MRIDEWAARNADTITRVLLQANRLAGIVEILSREACLEDLEQSLERAMGATEGIVGGVVELREKARELRREGANE